MFMSCCRLCAVDNNMGMGDVILNLPRQLMLPLKHDMCHAACPQYQACRLQAVSAVPAAQCTGSMLNDVPDTKHCSQQFCLIFCLQDLSPRRLCWLLRDPAGCCHADWTHKAWRCRAAGASITCISSYVNCKQANCVPAPSRPPKPATPSTV